MITRLAERDLATRFGVFREVLYSDGSSESIALVMGDVAGRDSVLCRVHSHCIGAHVFNSIECTCREELEAAQRMIQNEGNGVVIWLDQEGRGNGHLALILSMAFKKEHGQARAYELAGYQADARDFHAAAHILADLDVRSVLLISNSESKAERLRNDGVIIAGLRQFHLEEK